MQALIPAAPEVALEGLNLTLVLVVLVISLIALAMGAMFRRQVLAADPGTERMQEIGAAVQEGAQAYLQRQFKTLGGFVVLVFLLLFLLPAADMGVKVGRSVFFVIGALFSASIGYLGMNLAVRANVRVASAARQGDREGGMRIAFRTGGTVVTVQEIKPHRFQLLRAHFLATVRPSAPTATTVPAGSVIFMVDGRDASKSIDLDAHGQAKWSIWRLKARHHLVSVRYTPSSKERVFLRGNSAGVGGPNHKIRLQTIQPQLTP